MIAEEPIGKGRIERETPEVSEERSALVTRWQDQIISAAKHWSKDFKRMRRNMEFAAGKQWPGQTENDPRYTANLIQRVVKVMASALYAKNPTPVAQRRSRMDYEIWDGAPESAQRAAELIAQARAAEQAAGAAAIGLAPPEAALPATMIDAAEVQNAKALLADVHRGLQHRKMIDNIGRTLVCLLEYYLQEGSPSFKGQMKRVIKRARTCGVGYVKLGFQRKMQLSEDQQGRLADMAERLAVIGRLQADLADGVTDPHAGEAEELRLAMSAIQSEPEVIVREGVVFSFPQATRVIPSISTESLTEWAGSEWIAEEIMLTPDKVKETYGKDIGNQYRAYLSRPSAPESAADRRAPEGKDGLVRVWHVYDRATGLELVLAEGYPDFLREPAAPEVFIEQFYPIFAIAFNDVDAEGELFPRSDVENITHIQKEYNRSREGLRQHRIANRPLYLTGASNFDEEEEKTLENYPAHSILKVNSIPDGKTAADAVAPMAKVGIDPSLYETSSLLDEISRVTGNQEAVLGGISRGTATESNIAESSRQGTIGLDGDDLDDMLSRIFRAASQIMLTELSPETVKKIAGRGAVWPDLSRAEIMDEVWLEIKGGSTGRPDQARESATFERLAPFLLQIPGVSPRWMAERAVRLADDSTDLEGAFEEGLSSIIAMNRAAQISTGDPATDPSAQGAEGADRDRAPRPGGGDQNSYPVVPLS